MFLIYRLTFRDQTSSNFIVVLLKNRGYFKFVIYGSFKHYGINVNSFPMSKGSVQNCTKYAIDAYFTISALCYTTL